MSAPVSVLMYHQVGEFASPRTHRAGFCHVRRFRGQMRYLHRFGYSVISLEQALRGLFEQAALPPRPVVLTFDDGYRNFYDHAWPVLRRYGFPASVFLVAGLIGKNARWLQDDGRYGPPLLSREQLQELLVGGVNLGSHTLNHPRLAQLDLARQREEIYASKACLEDLLSTPISDFCYPYGSYQQRTRELVAEAGYRSALTCIRAAANYAENPFEIPRKAISYGDNLLGYVWKLQVKHRRKTPRQQN